MAYYLKGIFREKGYQFYVESPTNQIFIILDNVIMKELALGVEFAYWEKFDESHTVVRFATSWATSIEAVQQLECLL